MEQGCRFEEHEHRSAYLRTMERHLVGFVGYALRYGISTGDGDESTVIGQKTLFRLQDRSQERSGSGHLSRTQA